MRRKLNEFFGTAIMILLACGITSTSSTILATSVSMPRAFTLLMVASSFSISYLVVLHLLNDQECTFNPILTLSDLILKKVKVKEGIIIIVAQIIGGIVGAEILGIILSKYGALGANGYGELSIIGSNLAQAITVEVIISAILTMSYLNKSKNRNIYVALTIFVIYLFAIPYTNASANPARSIGPALMMGEEYIKQVWVFIVSPIAGSLIATLIYKLTSKK